MKVTRTQGLSFPAASTAIAGIVLTVAMLAGTGFIPSRQASAQVSGSGTVGASQEALALTPSEGQKNADHIRQPSDLGAVDAQLAGTRTPTVVRPAVSRPQPSQGSAPVGDGWKSAKVSWYGPGFIGNTMAGGGTLEWGSMVVAHRSLPFGTRIEFEYNGLTCVAVVQDRGPYAGGRIFDLGPGTAAALGFSGVGTVRYRVL